MPPDGAPVLPAAAPVAACARERPVLLDAERVGHLASRRPPAENAKSRPDDRALAPPDRVRKGDDVEGTWSYHTEIVAAWVQSPLPPMLT